MSTTQDLALDRDTIAKVDVSDQLTDILAIPEHLRDALWKVESAGLESWDSPGGIIVAGMGGSAIGGELARAILGDHASRPLITARAYGLPPWTARGRWPRRSGWPSTCATRCGAWSPPAPRRWTRPAA